jgi:hypothetical protein
VDPRAGGEWPYSFPFGVLCLVPYPFSLISIECVVFLGRFEPYTSSLRPTHAGGVSEASRIAPLSPLVSGGVFGEAGPSGVRRNPLMALAARKMAPALPRYSDSDNE